MTVGRVRIALGVHLIVEHPVWHPAWGIADHEQRLALDRDPSEVVGGNILVDSRVVRYRG
jgi:hypothetical protein